MMPNLEFKHIRLRNERGVVVIEMLSKDVQGPDMAKEFIAELMAVVEQDDSTPIVLNLRRAFHFSSMGYAALFKLVKYAKERGRPVRFCNMHRDVRVGGDIVGLPLVVEIDDSEESALQAIRTPDRQP
jgi:anti-anti-sigma factor